MGLNSVLFLFKVPTKIQVSVRGKRQGPSYFLEVLTLALLPEKYATLPEREEINVLTH